MWSSSSKQTTGHPEQKKKQQQQQHLAYKHTFFGLPSGLTLFGRHLMAVRMIIIIWGSGNHFSLSPNHHHNRWPKGRPRKIQSAPWRLLQYKLLYVGGCERRLAEYKIRLWPRSNSQGLQRPSPVVLVPRLMETKLRSLSAPSRAVINWRGSDLLIKLRLCSKDNSANQSLICQNQIYFNWPSVVAQLADDKIWETMLDYLGTNNSFGKCMDGQKLTSVAAMVVSLI